MKRSTSEVAASGRDTDLDDYRALALIWVLLVHCLYFTGIVAARWNVPKSFLLVEMPIIFFVAGAVNGRGRARGLGSFYSSRLSRIMIPFWVFAAVCLALQAWKFPHWDKPFDVRWIVPNEPPESPLAPVSWHLWFVPVYLSVMALFPLLRSAYERLSTWRWAPVVLLSAVLITFDHYGFRREYPRQVVFYSLWVYLGLFHARWKARPWPWRAVLAVALGAYGTLWGMIASGRYQSDFQWNKFPPNAAFLMLSVGHVALLSLAAPWIGACVRHPLARRLTAPYKSYGYTIYLFHAVVLAGLSTVFERWPATQEWSKAHDVAAIALLFPALTLLSPVVAWPFAFAERFRLGTPPRAVAPGRLDAPHAFPALARLRRVVGMRRDRKDAPR